MFKWVVTKPWPQYHEKKWAYRHAKRREKVATVATLLSAKTKVIVSIANYGRRIEGWTHVSRVIVLDILWCIREFGGIVVLSPPHNRRHVGVFACHLYNFQIDELSSQIQFANKISEFRIRFFRKTGKSPHESRKIKERQNKGIRGHKKNRFVHWLKKFYYMGSSFL